VAACVFLSSGAVAATTVSNVRAAQRAGTKLVDLDDDLTGTTGWVSVSVQVSADAGASDAVPAVAFTGDFGSVPAGRGRRVTLHAGEDWNGTDSPAMRFQITASDARWRGCYGTRRSARKCIGSQIVSA
jgi:hypothetical protein